MDIDGFPLATISERSVVEHDNTPASSITRSQHSSPPLVDTNNAKEIENMRSITKTSSSNVDQISKSHPTEVVSVSDQDDVPQQQDKYGVQRAKQMVTDHENTMLSSYTTGGDSDVIEIHQFSSADTDAYLDIYFETLNNRLRRYIGQDEQLQQFRAATKNRINSDPNAIEYQNVFLGKLAGEVVAAVTIIFPGQTPTIPLTSEIPEQNSCLTSIQRWLNRNGNYVPTNMTECYIEMIGVKNAFRNHGIGSAMLESAEYCAREAGAHALTIHTNGQRLRNYFERSGFNIDHTDHSAVWKWIIERRSTNKLSKILTLDEENPGYTSGSYINQSMAEIMAE